MGELIGTEPVVQVNVIPGTLRGSIASDAKRLVHRPVHGGLPGRSAPRP